MELINKRIVINDEEWKIADKVKRFGREWQYVLSRENVDGTYKTMTLNEKAIENIIASGSKLMGNYPD